MFPVTLYSSSISSSRKSFTFYGLLPCLYVFRKKKIKRPRNRQQRKYFPALPKRNIKFGELCCKAYSLELFPGILFKIFSKMFRFIFSLNRTFIRYTKNICETKANQFDSGFIYFLLKLIKILCQKYFEICLLQN